MTENEFNALRSQIIDALDRTMPGRRIGSTPPPVWTAQAKADIEKHGVTLDAWCERWRAERDDPRLPPTDLGLTSITQFCATLELPADPGYVREFRKQAILREMRREAA